MSLHESLRYELDKRWDYCLIGLHYYSTPPNILRYNCPNIRTTLVCPGHVYTPMFSTVIFPTFPFFAFFCPTVQPVTVVKKIIAALDDHHSQTILLPFYTNFIPYIGHLPSFLRDFVQWVSIRMLLVNVILSRLFFRSRAQTQQWADSSKHLAVVPKKGQLTNSNPWYKNEIQVSHWFVAFLFVSWR